MRIESQLPRVRGTDIVNVQVEYELPGASDDSIRIASELYTYRIR